jgi:hypothetical protein
MLTPEIEGTVSIRSSAERFLQAFGERVGAGLLAGQLHPRSNYAIIGAGPDHLVVRAADWWTAINVGLNTLQLRHVTPNVIRYHVRYWRWAAYAIGGSAALGLILAGMFLTIDIREYIARHQASRIPELSLDQNVAIAWLMVLFWGFIWPWLLIALHKGPLRRLVTRLIGEVDAGVPTASRS